MGGLERCIARLANHLDRERFAPMVICLNRSGDAADWITCDDVPIVELHKRPGNDPGVIRRLARALREHKVDIVHSHNWGTLLETTLARRWARTPVHVHAEHGLELDALRVTGWKSKLRCVAARWALRRVDRIVAVAKHVQQSVASRCGLDIDQIEVLTNGVDLDGHVSTPKTRHQLRKSIDVDDNAFVVGSIGRLAPVKDFGNAIKAISLLVQKGHNTHLVLVGMGPELDSLIAQVQELNMQRNIHFVGQQSNVGEWLSAMDLYINSSLSEGMSLSILEAMAAGLPSVVTDVGENATLIRGENGCGTVVRPSDANALATAILDQFLHRSLRKSFGQFARLRHATLYSVEQMVAGYEHVYTNALRRTLLSEQKTFVSTPNLS